MKTISETRVFDGQQIRMGHDSEVCGCPMTLTVYRPPRVSGSGPVLLWLSGLTCNDENMVQKAGAQRVAAELGLTLVAPDTSPRGLELPGEHDDWDFGSGAGFYVNATRAPWSEHYRMFDYVTEELPGVVEAALGPLGPWSVSGHSMGGHGALVAALRRPDLYRSASAFAPIAHPSTVPWGIRAFSGYLGEDRADWAAYDTVALLGAADAVIPMRIDQGADDNFLTEQLGYDALVAAAERFGERIQTHLHPGYDHSYYFIATFMEAHLRFHAAHLGDKA
ncbi:MAG: S-formylglutathione hydrolase [Pseudomonadota bacterium]